MPHVSLEGIQRVSVPLTAISGVIHDMSIDRGLTYTQDTGRTLSMVNQPVSAAARGIKLSPLQTTAKFLGKALPMVTVGASALIGAKIIDERGSKALLYSKDGRAAALGALGGSLMLMPTGATQVGAAGVLALGVANELGAFKHWDRTEYAAQTAA
jgi:hypothetical protein